MARRLINTPLKNYNDEFTFELWDMESDSVDLNHVVEFNEEGFDINWKGGLKADQAIMGSKCDFTMFLNEAVRSVIMPIAFSSKEFSLCVAIRKGGAFWWGGQVHAESISELIDDGTIAVSMTASDGLGMLSSIDWRDENGDKVGTKVSARDCIWYALRQIPWTRLMATGSVVMVEHEITRPVTTASSEVFAHTATDGNSYGTLDYLHLNGETFYQSSSSEEAVIFGQEFGSMRNFNPITFTDSRLVVKDIMVSLGATICFAEGSFHIFDRTRAIVLTDITSEDTIHWYKTEDHLLDAYGTKVATNFNKPLRGAFSESGTTAYLGSSSPNNAFRKGAVRKGLYPYRGATQVHTKAGSDLLYANGKGYYDEGNGRSVWHSIDGLSTPMYVGRRYGTNGNSGRFSQTSFGKDFPSVNNDSGGQGLYGMYSRFGRSELIEGINIANGTNEGQIRIHMAGRVAYSRLEMSGEVNTWGTLMIYKTRVEATAIDGTVYRLSRPVRTLRYDSQGNDADCDITGSGAGRYACKLWEGVYEWLPDTDPLYSHAFLDIPLGAFEPILEEGTCTKFMQTDYPSLDIYSPPLTKVESGSDNTLTKTTDEERSDFNWRHDFVYEMPATSASIEALRISDPVLEEWSSLTGPNTLFDSSGTARDLGYNTGLPTYRSAGFNGDSLRRADDPNSVDMFELSGLEIFVGDGTNEYDTTTQFFPTSPNGQDTINVNGTRIGATFLNTGKSTHGRYLTSTFLDPTTTEDNMKFIRGWDPVTKFVSASELVVHNVMQARGVTRQVIQGESFARYGQENEIFYPYDRILTNQLNTQTERYAVMDCNYSLYEGSQKLTCVVAPNTAEENIGGTTEEQDTNTRGPSRGPGAVKPDNSDLFDFVVAESQTGGGVVTGGGKFGDLFPMFINRY